MDRLRLVVIAGPLCAGKTTLAQALAPALPASILSARSIIERVASDSARDALQSAGEELESSTGGRWLAEAAAALGKATLVVDSARSVPQVRALRQLSEVAPVIYMTASEAERRRRLVLRADPIDASNDLDVVFRREPESINAIASEADLVLDTDGVEVDVVRRTALDFVVARLA